MGAKKIVLDKLIIEDKKLSITVISIVVTLTAQYLVLLILGDNNPMSSKVSLLSKIVVALFFISSLRIVVARRLVCVLATYSVAIFVILSSILLFPENQKYIISIIFPFLFISLPCFLYVISISNIETFMDVTKKGSWIIAIIGIVIGILVITGYVSIGAYNMGFSYYLLLPTVIFAFDYLENKKIKSLFIAGAMGVIILALGARGPLLALLIFYITYHTIDIRKRRLSSIMKVLFMVILIVIGMIYYKDLLIFMDSILLKYGIKSRSIRLLLSEEVVLSNRNFLYHDIIKAIIEHPLIGIGLAGDRVVLNGLYVHNIFLEIFSIFGVVIGFIISIALILFIFRCFFKLELDSSKIILIWFTIGFVPLLISSSVLIFYQFWIFMGVGLKLSFLNRNKQIKLY